MIKILLIVLGTISLLLGIIGAFVPGIPTTPFLLLSAGLYVRSSERLYHYLLHNKVLGGYIHKFREEKGMNVRTKVTSIFIMWIMISFSAGFFIKILTIKWILLFVGIVGTIIMGFVIPTAKKNKT